MSKAIKMGNSKAVSDRDYVPRSRVSNKHNRKLCRLTKRAFDHDEEATQAN